MIYLELKESLIRWLLEHNTFEFEYNGKKYTLRVTKNGKVLLN
jgi:hemin uptake protein HemP